MTSPAVAIVDIGSNSIKVLVAERKENGTIASLLSKTLDARISAGISRANPRLAPESMARGVAAITELIAAAAPFAPARTVLVATSAVRDAQNGDEFREQVRHATGYEIRILTGEEEATLIGKGLTCDPALADLKDFYVFDLGGGSLECLAFAQRRIRQAVSLQLGCVRLTEKLVPDAGQPISSATIAAIAEHTRATVLGKFSFQLPSNAVAVGTGGTLTTARAILAAKDNKTLEETPAKVSLQHLKELLVELSALSLDARKKVAGLPPPRADVYPTALATLIALAEAGRFDAYRHSLYNLRYGLAAEALGAV